MKEEQLKGERVEIAAKIIITREQAAMAMAETLERNYHTLTPFWTNWSTMMGWRTGNNNSQTFSNTQGAG